MQARMKERLSVQFRVPDFLASAPFPPLMLQTLIENAIKHGLEPSVTGGRIEVSARVDEATLIVDVVDDGVGFHPASNDGLGLANIQQRLQLLFGREAELVIESPPQGGTRASIRLPYQMMETA
jgi:LytS/YehU family sensor histidine kinase